MAPGGALQQRSHVPKFEKWEEEIEQYTIYTAACFECDDTAITGKSIAKPNETGFKFGRSTTNGKSDYNYSTDTESHDSTQISGPTSLDKSASSEQYLADVEGQQVHRSRIPRRLFGNYIRSSSEASSTEYSVSNHDRQKVTTEGSRNNVFLATPIRPNKSRVASNPDDDDDDIDLSFTSGSVPKFGSWNQKEIKSGQGITVVNVNISKEEKQNATAKLPPPMQLQVQTHTTITSAPADQTKKSKRYCCY